MNKSKRRATAQAEPVARDEGQEKPSLGQPMRWQVFFSCQRYPVYRSQLIGALMAGTVIPLDRLPNAALLDAVLLSTAAREFCNAEIVSDYFGLLERTRDLWAQPDWTCKVFSSRHARYANSILNGSRTFDTFEEQYIPEFVGWLLNQEMPQYFSTELEDMKQVSKHRRAA